jgi:hypothetical protein
MSTFGKLKVESIIWCRERDLVNECIVLSIKKVNETYYDTAYSQIIIELKVENSLSTKKIKVFEAEHIHYEKYLNNKGVVFYADKTMLIDGLLKNIDNIRLNIEKIERSSNEENNSRIGIDIQ